MRAVVQAIWQQKHPTPSSVDWAYHWHPATIDASLTGALAALDLALAGGEQSGWVVTPSALAWVRTFGAEVPSEQRRYVGLAGIAARPAPGDEAAWAETAPALLAAAELPAAAPHLVGGGGDAPRTVEVAPLAAAPVGVDDEELARAALFGGRAAAAAPADPALARIFGRVLLWLPGDARVRARSGAFAAAARPAPARTAAEEHLVHYLARALAASGDDGVFAAATWRLLRAACARRGLLETFAALADLAGVWDGAADLARYLAAGVLHVDEIARCDAAAPAPLFAEDGDAGMLWNRVLCYWGRGFLAGSGLEARLARVLAGRILVDHLVHLDGGGDPLRYVRRLRYEALLPAARVATLERALDDELPGIGA